MHIRIPTFITAIHTVIAFLVACFVGVAPASAFAQADKAADSGVTLTIGSKAPTLDIEHWVSDRNGDFTKVNNFTEGNVYVVEFWATWCPPCVASMPHLAELQDKFADQKVQVISVSDEDLETVTGFLENSVRGDDEKTYGELTSAYCLTTDPDGSTSVDYMEAAGQNGIPTAFIVGKSGLIEWTGHPMKMAEPLEQVVADKWDRESFAMEIREQQEREAKQRAVMLKAQTMMAEVDAKIKAGEEEEAIELMNSMVDDEEFAMIREQLIMIRTELAISVGGDAGVAAFRSGAEALQDQPEAVNAVAWAVVETAESGKEVSKDMLAAALAAAQAAAKAMSNDASVLDTVAHLHHLSGDLDSAIEVQTRAIENAGQFASELKPFLDELKAEKAKKE